jgi:hypothetical protein
MIPQPSALLAPSTAALVLALVVVNLVGFVVARSLVESTQHRREDADAPDTSAPDPAAEPGAEAVDCPKCEAENDPGYRYCRGCVSELPSSGAPGSVVASSFGRFVR